MKYCLFFLLFLLTIVGRSQKVYPLVKGFGGVNAVALPVEKPDPGQTYNIVVEVNTDNPKPEMVHELLEKIASIANLHVLGGVSPERLHIVGVIHGPAAMFLQHDSVYLRKYNVPNPNLPLFSALKKAGVRILVCAQSMVKRNIDPATIAPELEIALSAMTAISTYQRRGYMLLKL
ncbi:MAG: DsrE family protein [Chitinophagaceae bacterium]|jgi:intracellular sulfur oxidation DsrE/DsrF family protein|nr:DsrE family protein [Chitinophagaceae bacterium]MCA6515211.1 DsrE family protein [Chitinophagaceae bacterium]